MCVISLICHLSAIGEFIDAISRFSIINWHLQSRQTPTTTHGPASASPNAGYRCQNVYRRICRHATILFFSLSFLFNVIAWLRVSTMNNAISNIINWFQLDLEHIPPYDISFAVEYISVIPILLFFLFLCCFFFGFVSAWFWTVWKPYECWYYTLYVIYSEAKFDPLNKIVPCMYIV